MPSFTKYRPWLIGLIVVIVVVCVIFNIILFLAQENFLTSVNNQLTHKLSVKNIFFVFPNRFFLVNASIKDNVDLKNEAALQIPFVSIKISLLKLLVNHEIVIPSVTVYGSQIHYLAFSRFLDENLNQIMRILSELPHAGIKIDIKKTTVRINHHNENIIYISSLFQLKENTVAIEGTMLANQYKFFNVQGYKRKYLVESQPVQFKFQGELSGSQIDISSITVKRSDVYTKLWGEFDQNTLKLKGFTFIALNDPDKSNNNFFGRYNKKNFIGRLYKANDFNDRLSQNSVYILDIDSEIKLKFPDIYIEKLNFSLNNHPTRVKGYIHWADEENFSEIQVVMSPNYLVQKGFKKCEKIILLLSSEKQNNSLVHNGSLEMFYDKNDKPELPLEKIAVYFDGLQIALDEQKNINLDLDVGNLTCWTNNNEHKISLNNFTAFVNLRAKPLAFVHIRSPFYEGFLSTRLWIDKRYTPYRITSIINLDKVNANKLQELLVHFSKVQGRLSSKMNFYNYPDLKLEGWIDIEEGNLKNFDFFNWLAGSFDLASLKEINFTKAYTKFLVDVYYAGLRDIRLASEDITIGGYFGIQDNSLVSSKLSLIFSRALLKHSRKFKAVLGFFDKNTSELEFDFQLSGNQHAMNFQWLENEVKQKIQSRVPDFVERMIERGIDEMIEASPSSNPY